MEYQLKTIHVSLPKISFMSQRFAFKALHGCVFNCQPTDTQVKPFLRNACFHFLCCLVCLCSCLCVFVSCLCVCLCLWHTAVSAPLAFHFHFLRSRRFPGLRNTQWAHCSIHAGTLCIHETSLNRNGLLTTLKICVNLLVLACWGQDILLLPPWHTIPHKQ